MSCSFEEFNCGDTRDPWASGKFDTVILLDGSNFQQFYDLQNEAPPPQATNIPKRIHIDHHRASGEDFATLEFTNDKASSTVEVLLERIIPHEFIDKDLATLAYFGIVGDTGNFQWNFTPQTLRLVAMLVEKGADTIKIIDRLNNSRNKHYLEALSYAIEHTEYIDPIKTQFLCIPHQEIKEKNMDDETLKLISSAFKIEIARRVKGYDLGIAMIEYTPNKIDIGSRGRNLTNKINLSELFRSVGATGGGHFHAAGANIEGNFETVKQLLIDKIRNSL